VAGFFSVVMALSRKYLSSCNELKLFPRTNFRWLSEGICSHNKLYWIVTHREIIPNNEAKEKVFTFFLLCFVSERTRTRITLNMEPKFFLFSWMKQMWSAIYSKPELSDHDFNEHTGAKSMNINERVELPLI
jgi:hypothetical protein